MRRRGAICIMALLLVASSCSIVVLLALWPSQYRFVVPRATEVQVQRIGPGTHTITYNVAEPGWHITLDRRLRAARWLPPDFSGAPAQYTIYSYVNMYWFGSIWEEADVQGSAKHASITVRRWLRLRWWPGFLLQF